MEDIIMETMTLIELMALQARLYATVAELKQQGFTVEDKFLMDTLAEANKVTAFIGRS